MGCGASTASKYSKEEGAAKPKDEGAASANTGTKEVAAGAASPAKDAAPAEAASPAPAETKVEGDKPEEKKAEPKPKRRASAALMAGLKSGEVGRIVDKAEADEAEAAKQPAATPEPAANPDKVGYVVGFFDMKDPEKYKTVFGPMVEPTLIPYGGRTAMLHALPPEFAAAMGMKESKGFGTTGQMAFTLEFETFEKAMGWFTGPEYAAVIATRDEVADFKMAVCEARP